MPSLADAGPRWLRALGSLALAVGGAMLALMLLLVCGGVTARSTAMIMVSTAVRR